MNSKSLLPTCLTIAALALLLAVPPLSAAGKEKGEAKPATKGAPKQGRADVLALSITAEVTAIDQKTREVSLKGPQGNTITFKASAEVQRLDEVGVGDMVAVDYVISVVYDLREPTAAEKKEPLVVIAGEGRASKVDAPAGGAAARIKAVCTIEGLDRPGKTATLKGPGGNYVTVGVHDAAAFPKLRIGQSVVVTYTEALAVSLQKLEPAKK